MRALNFIPNLIGYGFAGLICSILVFGLLSFFPPVQVVEIEKEKIVCDTVFFNESPHAKFVKQPVKKISKNRKKYIERFEKVAQVEMEKFGIPASITIAQGLLESKAGSSRLAGELNNHFGIKCFSRKCKKGHCTNFPSDHHKDFFRNYNSAWESFRDHSKFLSGKRYKHLKKMGKDYKAWAEGLQEAGYATDKNYAKKLIDLIEKLELYRLDI